MNSGYRITTEHPEAPKVLTPEASAFLVDLHRAFNKLRLELLAARRERQTQIDNRGAMGFADKPSAVRDSEWSVAPTPADLQDRRVEITGPCERKMIINALNSGARVFMADCEDAQSPSWLNQVMGQVNLMDAVRRTIRLEDETRGKVYELAEQTATLLVRPRGWHLDERHFLVDDTPVSGSLFDFGLYFFHNAKELLERGSGPYFYLAKLESYLEAKLWNDVFVHAQETLGIPQGSIRATVLIETIHASHQMEEILYELRDHMAGLNAGRWDYIFSCIKAFHKRPEVVFPDRAQISMTVPFMHAYTELLVRACHRRGAHAIGGMAAFIPNRRDPGVTKLALAKVREDKKREADQGFDGTWVAHPDLVPVAEEAFVRVLGSAPNQKSRQREDVKPDATVLTDYVVDGGKVTESGVRLNVSVGIRYLDAWLSGNGAAAINNLMEDVATCEISRAQLWEWVHKGATLEDGRVVTLDLYRSIRNEELAKIGTGSGRVNDAVRLMDALVESETFEIFLTVPAYRLLD